MSRCQGISYSWVIIIINKQNYKGFSITSALAQPIYQAVSLHVASVYKRIQRTLPQIDAWPHNQECRKSFLKRKIIGKICFFSFTPL